MVAAQYQEGDAAINLLLDRGAQVAAPADGAPVFNANPFFLASYAGNAKSLKRLLAAGGKLDEAMIAIGTSRTTPMLGAFKFGDIEVAAHAARSRRAGRLRRWQRHHDAGPQRR